MSFFTSRYKAPSYFLIEVKIRKQCKKKKKFFLDRFAFEASVGMYLNGLIDCIWRFGTVRVAVVISKNEKNAVKKKERKRIKMKPCIQFINKQF